MSLFSHGGTMIRLENVTFTYMDDDFPAVDDVTLHIEEGSFVVLIGHNGSGKSTLARLLNALLIPTHGDVWVDNMNTKEEDNIWEIRKKVGMVFQNPDNQLVSTVVEEEVAFGPENLGVEPEQIEERITKSLEQVGMSSYRKHPPHMLSGGQKQRIAIAGVLAMEPRMIVFDESTAMLDPQGRREVVETIKALKKKDMTILLITHFMEEAVFADRVLVMDDGKIVMDGSPKEIFSRTEELHSYQMEFPEVIDLANTLRSAGMNLTTDILERDQLVTELCRLL